MWLVVSQIIINIFDFLDSKIYKALPSGFKIILINFLSVNNFSNKRLDLINKYNMTNFHYKILVVPNWPNLILILPY